MTGPTTGAGRQPPGGRRSSLPGDEDSSGAGLPRPAGQVLATLRRTTVGADAAEGEIIRLESPQKRIALLLSILGSDQPVELPLDDVEGLPDEA